MTNLIIGLASGVVLTFVILLTIAWSLASSYEGGVTLNLYRSRGTVMVGTVSFECDTHPGHVAIVTWD